MEYEQCIHRLVDALEWDASKVITCLEILTLKQRGDYLTVPTPYRREDVYPWRFNRRLSLLRRPLILVESSTEKTLVWGKRQVIEAGRYLFESFWSGRLEATSHELQVAISKNRNRVTGAFARSVADQCRRFQELLVKERYAKIGRRYLGAPGSRLGDVDVLVAEKRKRKILLLEVKGLGAARTPFEMASEITELVHGSHGHPSMIEKHKRRLEWIQQNLAEVLADLDLDSLRPWTVEVLMVVDEELMSPHFVDTDVRILPFRELQGFLETWVAQPK
jgi:hypothetical protein